MSEERSSSQCKSKNLKHDLERLPSSQRKSKNLKKKHDLLRVHPQSLNYLNSMEDDEDIVRPKAAKKEYMPSQAEVDEHEITHFPYRSWCPSCVRGAGVNDPHKRHQPRPEIATISLDYSFLSSADEKTEGCMPVLNLKDTWSKRCCSEIVPRKGAHSYAVEVVQRFITSLGYTRVILKSDQEPAIMALKEMVRNTTNGCTITFEQSPVGSSSSNADVESQIRRTTGLTRVLKACLESYLKKEVDSNANVIPWIVRHAASIFNYYRKDTSGKTPWEYTKGRPFNKPLAIVGESVHFLLPNSLDIQAVEVKLLRFFLQNITKY